VGGGTVGPQGVSGWTRAKKGFYPPRPRVSQPYLVSIFHNLSVRASVVPAETRMSYSCSQEGCERVELCRKMKTATCTVVLV
jgi:hypothetical protein